MCRNKRRSYVIAGLATKNFDRGALASPSNGVMTDGRSGFEIPDHRGGIHLAAAHRLTRWRDEDNLHRLARANSRNPHRRSRCGTAPRKGLRGAASVWIDEDRSTAVHVLAHPIATDACHEPVVGLGPPTELDALELDAGALDLGHRGGLPHHRHRQDAAADNHRRRHGRRGTVALAAAAEHRIFGRLALVALDGQEVLELADLEFLVCEILAFVQRDLATAGDVTHDDLVSSRAGHEAEREDERDDTHELSFARRLLACTRVWVGDLQITSFCSCFSCWVDASPTRSPDRRASPPHRR